MIFIKRIIDLNALRHNAKIIKSRANSKLCAVVKADAYGHGMTECAKALSDIARCFSVARAEEALELRAALPNSQILLMGAAERGLLKDLIAYDITLTVFEYENAKIINDIARKIGAPAKIHLKVDSGMNRLGISDKAKFFSTIESIKNLKAVKLCGIYTHYAAVLDPQRLKSQYDYFFSTAGTVKNNDILLHAANSEAIFSKGYHAFDMVRPGISLYGYLDLSPDLKRVMRVESRIVQVKTVPKGGYIGYDNAYRASIPTPIALIALGYGDGYPRFINKGYVIIRGVKCPILGKVCMDLTAVSVKEVPNVSPFEKVTVLGEGIDAKTIADFAGTISYDILTCWTPRVKKVYIKGND